jgi:outer membrane protein insertion porin family
VVSAVAVYDPERKGFIVTFTIEEGQRYRFSKIDIQSNIPAVDARSLFTRLRTSTGGVYNSEAVEKSVEHLSIEVARRGYPFAVVRPRGDRDHATATISVTYVIDEGPRVYVERINIRGNTRTRDYVIRREFDLGEGDAYNRALIDRAERRLKGLGYFKTVKITNEPGSAPDRIVLNVDVEEQPTGEFSLSGGYSTNEGFMAEVSVGERNLLGQGQYAKFALQYGQRSRGFELSFAEPHFMGYRMSVGTDFYVKQQIASRYVSYDSTMVGGGLRTGFALNEELGLQVRYGIYRQEITLPTTLNNCIDQTPPVLAGNTCYGDGEASLAIRRELANGPVLVSFLGYTLAFSNLDNPRNPTSGVYAEIRQDFAGIGGDVNFVRTNVESRTYYEILTDVVGVFRVQAGNIVGWGGKDVRMLDHFKMGPNLVRGFATAGLGPRDVRDLGLGSNQDALGGTNFWGASFEVQAPFQFLPKDAGIKWAVFADAGSLWGYKGPTSWDVTGETLNPADSASVRAAVGAGIVWNSPFGPLRFDYAVPLMKESYDRVQRFRFGGGTKF